MQKVKFNRHWGPFNPGEHAGFDAGKAKELVDQGVAELAEPPAPPAPPKDPAKESGKGGKGKP